MSQVFAPYGLLPAWHPSGILRPMAGTILSGYATWIFQNAPVAIAADGTITAAAAGARAIGTFEGVEWTGTDGRRHVDNKWTAGTIATDIVAYYSFDNVITYQIQANGPITVADIGSQADWTANGSANGNQTTGISTVALDQATLTNAGNAGLRIIGLAPYPDNAFGDAFTIVYVQISEQQNTADRAAY